MATLHVRDVPAELYQKIHLLASSNSHSLTAEVIHLLSHAVEEETLRTGQRTVLSRMRRRRFVPPPDAPDSTELLREDRNR